MVVGKTVARRASEDTISILSPITMKMNQPVAFINGEMVSRSELSLPIADAGVMMGVTIAEQLRTFRGEVFRLESHLARLKRSLKIAGIDPKISMEALGEIGLDLLKRNRMLLDSEDDLGLTILVTPGVLSFSGANSASKPTVCLHTQPVAFSSYVSCYDEGQPVVITDVVQVSPESWLPELKCRSRMHYFLADQKAMKLDAQARALLLDWEGFVAEASTANVVLYREGKGLFSPPLERILPGISLAMLEELATAAGIPFTYGDLTPEEFRQAEEIMLCSTSPCLLPVTRLDGKPVGEGIVGPLFQKLITDWGELVGLDIIEQAKRFATR